jgi:16S rRNA processing protein RimM
MPDATTPPADALVVVGRVRKAHGIRGELVVEPLTNEPAAVFAAGRRLFGGSPDGDLLRLKPTGATPALTVRRASAFKEGLIVAVEELADRTAAEGWRERTLLALETELPPPDEDEVYLHELVGMRVALADGTPVGEVVDYFELPHGLMLELRREGQADTALLPYRPEIVVEVDTRARVITVAPPEGLFE